MRISYWSADVCSADLLTTHQIPGEVDHHEDLGDFRRLDVEEAEANPAHRAVDLATDARQQHHHQKAKGAEQHHPAQALQGGARHKHGETARHQADQQINKDRTRYMKVKSV